MEPTPIFVETEYVLARLQQKNSVVVDVRNREHFERARRDRADIHVAHGAYVIQRIGWIVQHFHPDRGESAGRIEPAALEFMGVVKQCVSPADPAFFLVSYRAKDSYPAFPASLVQCTNYQIVPSPMQQSGFSAPAHLTECHGIQGQYRNRGPQTFFA